MQHSRLTILFLAAVVAAPLSAQDAASERIEVPLSSPGAPVVLQVDVDYGGIEVDVHDDDSKVIVELRPRALEKIKEPPKPRADGLRRIEDTSVGFEISEEDNVIEIEAEGRRAKRGIDVFVLVPARTSVRLDAHDGGDVMVRGVRGSHEIENHNGAISARGLAGSVVAETHNGAVTIELTSIEGGTPMALSTWNGDIDVTFPPGLKADLVMQTENGEILSGFDLTLRANRPRAERSEDDGGFRLTQDRETRGTVGGGGPEIRLETYNGDIIVRRSGS